jgi:cullin-associated NEDD8-dissociated protein 1
VLISRFGDREESVKIEVWATYVVLLNQTSVYGGTVSSRDSDAVAGSKRKREDETMDLEDSPLDLLRSQVAALCKSLLRQLQSKTSASTSQAGFQLLIELVTVLPGALTQQASSTLTTAKTILGQSIATTTATLHTTTLSFLSLFFKSHPAHCFNADVPTITPVLLTEVTQKHPRVAAEAFKVFSALLQALAPVTSADWATQIYKEVVNRLSRNDTDAEVRAAAEEVIGDLWVSATPVVADKGGAEWESLRKGGRPEGAVKVVHRVAASSVPMSSDWTVQSIDWILNVLRKSGRGGRVEAFECLDVLLSKCVLQLSLILRPLTIRL